MNKYHVVDDYEISTGHRTLRAAIAEAKRQAANDDTVYVVKLIGVAKRTAPPVTYKEVK